MKLTYIFLLSLIGFQFNTLSQNCSTSSHLTKGKTWEVSNYNKRDKFTGKIQNLVLEAKQEGNVYTWKVQQKNFDKKEELVNTSTYTLTCENGNFEIETAGLIPSETLEMIENLEANVDVKMTQNTINYPTSKDPSFELKEGSVQMTAKECLS